MEEKRCGKVLAVDDDADTVRTLCLILEAEGHVCATARSGKEALERCAAERFDCMLLDATLGDTTAIALAKRLAQSPEIRPNHLILITGHPKEEFWGELRNGLVDGYIQKPADLFELAGVVVRSIR